MEHAIRMFWVVDEAGLALTRLGRALLSASQRQHEGESGSDVVVLDRKDPLAYATLIGRLASFGAATLVDPYLRLDQLHDLVTQTKLMRVLVSKQHKGSAEVLSGMAVYLGGRGDDRKVEVRASADTDVHDRMVLTPDGSVHLLGYSLNGIEGGNASTLLIELPKPAAEGQAAKIDQWWTAAEVVQPATDPESTLPEPQKPKPAAAKKSSAKN